MNKINRFALIIVLVIVSFLGFCTENIFLSWSVRYIDNRNMVLPFLWGYGLSILAIFLIFGTPDNPKLLKKQLDFGSSATNLLYYFTASFLCVCVGEVLLGYAVEYGLGIIWWDYTRLPLHITRYTSIPTSLCFATLITVFMKFFFYPLVILCSKVNPLVLKALAVFLVFVLSVDMLNSFLYMLNRHEILNLWRIDLSFLATNTHKIIK